MKAFAGISAVGLAMVVTGCNFQPGLPGMNGSGGSSPGNGQAIEIATPSGFMSVSRSDVTLVTVRFDATGEKKEFTYANAQNLISPIALNDPQEVGLEPAQELGEITIQYQNQSVSGDLQLLIESGLQGQFVEDADHPEIHYQSSVPLDSQWIGG